MINGVTQKTIRGSARCTPILHTAQSSRGVILVSSRMFGCIEEQCGNLADAKFSYLFAAELEEASLAPYLHAAKCLLKLDQAQEAITVLNRAMERIKDNPLLENWKPKVEEMLCILNKAPHS